MEDNNIPLETIIISLETVSLLCDEQNLVLLTHTAYTCLTRRAFLPRKTFNGPCKQLAVVVEKAGN